jgi:hypothetical protein
MDPAGRWTGRLLRHSYFPSVSFYRLDRSGTYQQAERYDGVPHYGLWKAEGWGPADDSTAAGPTRGNPWGYTLLEAKSQRP